MNPNARVAGATTLAAAVITWAAHKLGWTLESYYAVVIAGGATSALLWVGKEGLRGVWQRILNGRGE